MTNEKPESSPTSRGLILQFPLPPRKAMTQKQLTDIVRTMKALYHFLMESPVRNAQLLNDVLAHTRPCEKCGGHFYSPRSNRRFCSQSCQNVHGQQQYRDRLRQVQTRG